MDKVGANFEFSTAHRDRLFGARSIQLPIGGKDFAGFVDLIRMKYVEFIDAKDGGRSYMEGEIPEEHKEAAEAARHNMVEVAATGDEDLMNKYLEGEELTERRSSRASVRDPR